MAIAEPTTRIGKWLLKLTGYSFEVFPKGVTFARMEAGLACYELRDAITLPRFRENDEEAGGEICAEALEKELHKQQRMLLRTKAAGDTTEEWLMQQREAGRTELEIMDEAWGKMPVKHTGWHGWNLWFDGAVRKVSVAAGGIVLRNPEGKLELQVGIALNGRFTCNEAEYSALIRGLREALAQGIKALQVYGDSKIVCYQVLKRFSVKLRTSSGSMKRWWN